MDQINNSARIGRLTTRLVTPTPRPQTPASSTWQTCSVTGCNKITTRRADMVRHMTENHGTTKIPCPYCPGSYQRSINLTNHIKKVHKYASSNLTTGRTIGTQTILQGQGEINNVDISRITFSYLNCLNPTPSANPIMGRQGTSTLSLRNSDVQSVIQKIQNEQKSLLKSCGFKRVGALEKALAKSKNELTKLNSTVDEQPSPPSTSGTHTSHPNFHQGEKDIFFNSILNLDDEEDSDLEDSTQKLNNILFSDSHVDSDLKLSESESSIDSIISLETTKDNHLDSENIKHSLQNTTDLMLGLTSSPSTHEPSPIQEAEEIEFIEPSDDEEWDKLILSMNM